jgi:hypothetical protein
MAFFLTDSLGELVRLGASNCSIFYVKIFNLEIRFQDSLANNIYGT